MVLTAIQHRLFRDDGLLMYHKKYYIRFLVQYSQFKFQSTAWFECLVKDTFKIILWEDIQSFQLINVALRF